MAAGNDEINYKKYFRKNEEGTDIPVFDDIINLPIHPKRSSSVLVRVAASVVLVVTAAAFYFYNSRRPAKETMRFFPVSINQNLPTQSLLDKSLSTEYIWNWKAPTDRLLQDATKSLITEL